jgi:small subunit ribosomal protein S21
MNTKEPLGPIEVEVRDGNVMKALRVLRKKVGKEGFIQEMKDRQFYTKPSQEKHNEKRRKQRERERQKNGD